jgi:putative membrane protein
MTEPIVETRRRASRLHLLLLAVVSVVLVWSAIRPHDYFTWMLEVAPGVMGIGLLVGFYRRFRFTTMVYVLVAVHVTILFVGGHYTYAQVPLFNWIRDTMHLSRNHFDRVGHYAQGFVPAIIIREVLLRCSPLVRGKWLVTIVLSMCLAISAIYELFEWGTSVMTGESATAFLGTQGDETDTQKDMFLCLIGATSSLLLLSRWHDRQMRTAGFRPVAEPHGLEARST